MIGTQHLRSALGAALASDPSVHLLGEAVELSAATSGLLAEHPERVHLLPAADATLVGLAVGLAFSGCRPVVELSGPEALWGALQQIGQEAGGFTGDLRAPIVIRVPVGPGGFDPTGLVLGADGVGLASPGTAADCGILLRAALRADHPVVLLEPRTVLASSGDAVDDLPLGAARHVYAGDDATVLAWGEAVPAAMRAAEVLAAEGRSVDLFDLRSLRPLDAEAVVQSIGRTGRPVLVGGVAAALRAVVEGAFLRLECPPTISETDADAVAASVRGVLAW